MRQHISRLMRKTLSFSKKIENHIGAIWFFIHHDNASLLFYDYPNFQIFKFSKLAEIIYFVLKKLYVLGLLSICT
jgi:hypothetical protein